MGTKQLTAHHQPVPPYESMMSENNPCLQGVADVKLPF